MDGRPEEMFVGTQPQYSCVCVAVTFPQLLQSSVADILYLLQLSLYVYEPGQGEVIINK